MSDEPLRPTPALLARLGSIIVHADELLSANGHEVDRVALTALLNDPEVIAWLEAMQRLALVPVKRNG